MGRKGKKNSIPMLMQVLFQSVISKNKYLSELFLSSHRMR